MEIFLIEMNKIDNCFLDCGMHRKKGVMANVIVHVVNAWDLSGEEY